MVEFIQSRALDFDDVMIVPRKSSVRSRADVELNRKFVFKNGQTWEGIPIIASNMENIGTHEVATILSVYNMLTVLTKGTYDHQWTLNVFSTYGLGNTVRNHPLICLDVANGYMNEFVKYVSWVRKDFPSSVIMAGNVVTPEGTEALIMAGADIIKVGLGSGSACLTREKTGVGYPQLSAVIECAERAFPMGAYICSDGGHRTPGDVAKSFAAGADFVMLGNMFAGTDETSSYLVGNAVGTCASSYKTREGETIWAGYKGSLSSVVDDLLGGLRSACSYVGAHNLLEFQERAKFVRVT